jgi:hypothetical protein
MELGWNCLCGLDVGFDIGLDCLRGLDIGLDYLSGLVCMLAGVANPPEGVSPMGGGNAGAIPSRPHHVITPKY